MKKDITALTEDELFEYGCKRLKVMLKMERDAQKWLKEKNTPFQQHVLETARHHVQRCMEMYGVTPQDI